MKKVDIDLSEQSPCGPCCVSESSKDPQKYYPSVTYHSDEPIELPESGRLVIEFKKVESRESNWDGKESHSCTFEIRKITGVEANDEVDESNNAGKVKDEAGDALDKLKEEYVKTKKKDY
jgi:hypothetical protein